jgi:carboxymethylenebutenolidase
MAGSMIEFSGNGKPYTGYLSPSKNGKGPGVIVIQEWWGLVGHIKDVCDRFAAEGFTALAPDFYHGKETKEPDEAASLMMALEIDDAEKVIHGAIDALLSNEATTGEKVAVVGFCMGGQLALFAGTRNRRIGAVVDCYGIHPNVKLALADLAAPVLGIFAEQDAFVPPEAARKLETDLRAAGKRCSFTIFPGVGHAFLNDSRPDVYDAAAAERAWGMLVSFLRAELVA